MRRYFRTHIICRVPLKGYFRYLDQFQIYPIEDDALPLHSIPDHYPMYLEYSVDVEDNISDVNLDVRTLNKEKEIVNLLSVFTAYRFFYYTGSRNQWACIVPPISWEKLSAEQQNLYLSQQCCWTQATIKTKYLPYEIEIKHLSALSWPIIEQWSNSKSYFAKIHDDFVLQKCLNINSYIILPPSLTQCLSIYYSLPNFQQKQLQSSIYLACDGLDIKYEHKALRYLSLVSALEGLTKLFKYAYPKQKSKGKYPSKSDVFLRLLKDNLSSDICDIEQYKDIYKFRCDVTHDNTLFALDYGVILDENNMRPYEDWFLQHKAESLFRSVLTNILLNGKKEEWITMDIE